MSDRCLGSCDEAREDYGLETTWCCLSCHCEWEEDCVAPFEIATDDGYFMVCCSVYEAWKKQGMRR